LIKENPEITPVKDVDSRVEGNNTRKLRIAWNLVESAAKSGAFAGAVGLVSRDGKILFHKSCGYASIYPSKILMRRSSIFDVASLTKAIATTTAIMLLVDRGKIDINKTVCSYLPNFGGDSKTWKNLITVKQLLTHTSGLPAWSDLYTRHNKRAEIIDEVCSDIDTIAEPGTAFVYSDLGFILLGKLVETLSGKRLDSFVKSEIFTPLGMRDTCYNPKQKSSRLVSTEYSNWRGGFVRGKVHDENAFAMDGVSGHAGLFSTAEDLENFCQRLLENSNSLLSSTTMRIMTSDQTSKVGGYVGLGWWVKTNSTPNIGTRLSPCAFGHNGYTGTSVWIDPQFKLSIILLTNRIHPIREGNQNLDKSVGIMMSRKNSWGSVNSAFQDSVIDSIVN
jgi:CubicO group peptidase (beta-lactamase class C family)